MEIFKRHFEMVTFLLNNANIELRNKGYDAIDIFLKSILTKVYIFIKLY